MALPPISFTGLGSGLDTRAIVDRLLAIERAPITKLQRKAGRISARSDATSELHELMRTLKSRLDTFTTGGMRLRSAATDTPTGTLPYLLATASSGALPGSFKVKVDQLATATKRTTTGAVGQGVDKTVALADGGFVITPTTGTFRVNGAAVTIDAATVLSDGADAPGANTIIAKISDATGGAVTASLVADGNGTAENALRLTSASTIQLGSGADTSNFLSAAGLLASENAGAGPYTRTSVQPMGGTLTTEVLDDARISGLASTTGGQITLNGVTISYDTTVDSLATVIARINASGARVFASWDPARDKITLQARETGATAMSLADTTGNLLSELGVLAGGSETLGVNARYQVDTGGGYQTRYSTSNTVTDAFPGASLTLMRLTGASEVTVTVGNDAESMVANVKSFVEAFNAAYAKSRALTGKDGAFQNDSTLSMIDDQLRSIAGRSALGVSGAYTQLWQVGITFGAVGAAVGSTNQMVLDESKLRAALTDDPDAVANLFDARRTTAALNGGGTSSIVSASGDAAVGRTGTYRIVDDGSGNLTAYFTPDGGSEDSVGTSGVIVANGTNTGIIPGVTLTAGAVLQAGTSFVRVTALERGVAREMRDYAGDLTRTGGVFSTRLETDSDDKAAVEAQIARLNERLAQREKQLLERFRRLEEVLSKLQTSQGFLDRQVSLLQAAAQQRGGGARRPSGQS